MVRFVNQRAVKMVFFDTFVVVVEVHFVDEIVVIRLYTQNQMFVVEAMKVRCLKGIFDADIKNQYGKLYYLNVVLIVVGIVVAVVVVVVVVLNLAYVEYTVVEQTVKVSYLVQSVDHVDRVVVVVVV